jgi:ribonuclease PH
VATVSGNIVEIQGTAEGEPVPRSDLDKMTDLALEGVSQLCEVQRQALSLAGVEIDQLLIPRS